MTSHRSAHRVELILTLLGALLVISCHKNVPPPPPPPVSNPAPPPAPAPTITLSASSPTIDRGQSVTLQWDARNAGTVRIEPGLGELPASGQRQVTPNSSVTYTATATGPGGSASATARVTVNAPPPPPATEPPPPPRSSLTEDEIFSREVQTIYFDYDKADIRPDQMSRLQANATWLKDHPNERFTIEGNCDERGSQEYNLGLGNERANAVKNYLVGQGVAAGRINVISYGEERPVCRDATEDCMQRNRRADFVRNP